MTKVNIFYWLTALIMLQFTMVSCEDNADIIQDDKAQIEDYQKTDPVNEGGKDDDDEDGN